VVDRLVRGPGNLLHASRRREGKMESPGSTEWAGPPPITGRNRGNQ
jgi:hypothetical protein